jgi:hypothetical protein
MGKKASFTMTYENAENGVKQNCRKSKLVTYTKLQKGKVMIRQKCPKFDFKCLEDIFIKKLNNKIIHIFIKRLI